MNPIEFPYHIMDGVAKEYAELYTAHTECPLESLYISYLTLLGASLSDKLGMLTSIRTQPRLYVILLGQSADDRKSSSIDFTIPIFDGLVHVCEGVGSAEGLARNLREETRLVLYFDEFRQFVGKCSIQSSALLECVNILFEKNRWGSNTKDKDNKVEDGYLSFISASTLDTYERVWSAAFSDIGFNNRTFIVPASGEKKYNLPPPVPPEKNRQIIRKTSELIRYVGDELRIPMTDEANEIHYKWYMIPDRGIHAKRLDGYSLRFMSLLAVIKQQDKVDVPIVNDVIELMEWQLNMRKFYAPIDADNEMAKMEIKIIRELDNRGAMSEGKLKVYTNAKRGGLYFYDCALKNLIKHKDIEFNKTKKIWERL